MSKKRMLAKIIPGLLLSVSIFVSTAVWAQEVQTDSPPMEAAYFKAMLEVNDEIFQRQFEYPFLALLDDSEKTEYQNLATFEEKKKYMQLYWKKNNPNPLLQENEPLNLFLGRCTYVQQNFPSPDPPYYDDRGKYYLKYGKPEQRYIQEADTKHVQLFANDSVYEWVCSKSSPAPATLKEGGERIPIYYSVQGNETWVYTSEDNDPAKEVVLHFVKKGKTYREVHSLAEVINNSGPFRHLAWHWSDLMKERAVAVVASSVNKTAKEIWELEDVISVVVTGMPAPLSSEYLLPNPALSLFFMKFRNDAAVRYAKNQMPPRSFVDETTPNDLSFTYEMAQFREPNNTTRVEFSILAPLRDNLLQNQSSDTLDIEYACLLQDSMVNPRMKFVTSKRFPVKLGKQRNLENTVGWVGIYAQPQTGAVTLQVRDLNTWRIGYHKQPVSIRDFSGDDLMISDVQLLTDAADTVLEKISPVFNKEGRIVSPYPYQGMKKTCPLLCYFEIYNLHRGISSGEYIIDMTVKKKQGRGIFRQLTSWMSDQERSSIGLGHTRTVVEDTAHELIGIDFSNLNPGEYRLEITVTDAMSEYIKTSAQKDIVILR